MSGFAVLAIFFTAAETQAQAYRSSITGFVFDQSRRPIVSVPVELMNEVNSVIQRTRTNNSGRYNFIGLSQGRFSIRVLPLGTDLAEQSADVEISGIGVRGRPIADHIQHDFYLRPRKNRSTAGSITGTIYAQEVPAGAETVYKNAVEDLDDEKVDDAVIKLETAIKEFPTYYAALERLGIIYLNQKKFENARDYLTRAVAVNARSFNGWYGIAVAEYSLQRPREAVEAGKKAVEVNPDSIEAFLLLGISHRQAKEYEFAEKTLKNAEKLSDGRSPDVHWNLALLYAHNLKRYKDAADQLERYLKADPNVPNAEVVKKLIKQFRTNPPTG